MKTTKKIGCIVAVACAFAAWPHNVPAAPKGDKAKRVEAFSLSDVRVTSPTLLRVQRLAMDYMMGLDADRLVAPYLKEAGLTPKAENYPNWESMGLDGHICGHYLSGLAHMYAATGESRIRERLDYTVAQLAEAQQAAGDGYLSGVPGGRQMWNRVFEGNIDAGAFSLNGKWVPLYNIHKPMAGLRDAYWVGGCRQAREVFVKLCSWFADGLSKLSDEKLQQMLISEHGGLNEVFADAYEITGSTKYLTLAKRLTHNSVLTPLLEGQDRLNGMHANTQIPKIIGVERIACLDHDSHWHDAADFFWQTVTTKRSVTIGGNSVREHFNPTDDFSTMIESEQGPETCNTYNMLRLTKMLFLEKQSSAYMDFYERAMLNHILSTISTMQGGFVYFTPMRPGHYRVYSQPQTSFWCCVGSGLENHSRYGEMIFAHRAEQELYVNTFVPAELDWRGNKTNVKILGDFPWNDKCEIHVTSKKPREWTMKIRKPEWCDEMTVTDPDGNTLSTPDDDGYISIPRTWVGTQVITVHTPMKLAAHKLPDGSNYQSLTYGPMVLAADLGADNQVGKYSDESRGGHVAVGPKMALDEVPSILAEEGDLLSKITKSPNALEWTVETVWPEKYKGVKLVPFVNLSERRYQIYFNVMGQKEMQAELDRIREVEEAARALAAKTVDDVVCGEQQPETDHQFAHEASVAGVDDDNSHWRETSAWFSYKLKAKDATKVCVTFRQMPNRAARVFCNGREVGSIAMGADARRSLEFAVPEAVGDVMEVRIEVGTGGKTPRIYEVRSLK